jgi:2-phospho-L-lactate/phosphoenolpyruvate guanylyltransferase
VSGVDLSRVVAFVPVRSLSGAKTRLGEPLDQEERTALIVGLARQTIRAARASVRLAAVEVVSRDPELLEIARGEGAGTILQRSEGLNEALDEALRSSLTRPSAVLVLPGDLPGITTGAIDDVVSAAEHAASDTGRAVVAVVPDRHGSGTNAMLVSPPGAVPFLFGGGSRRAHADAAAAAGAAYVEVDGPLAFDLDTPDDLLEADALGLDRAAGR